MPPFYLGSTDLSKIVKQKYRGSVSSKDYVKIWKLEQKNNPQLFRVQILSLHETRQAAYEAEDKLLRLRKCVVSPLYINQRCAKGLGFHPKGKQSPRYGVKHTDATKAFIGKLHKGKTISLKQRKEISVFMTGRDVSDETRKKLSIAAFARPPMSEETCQNMSVAKKGVKQKTRACCCTYIA